MTSIDELREFASCDTPLITNATMPYTIALAMITASIHEIARAIIPNNIIDPISTIDDLEIELRDALRDSSSILFPIFDELDADHNDDDLTMITPRMIANAINLLIIDE
jgi:hypothetical protein